jgi:hypothetical protein
MKRVLCGNQTKSPIGTKKQWEVPQIVMEHSLVVRAQDPLETDPTKPKDPFLAPLVGSDNT